MTETFYHNPVMLNESIKALNINPAGIYIDATFGGGGHSKEILKQLKTGKLIAFDVDNNAQANIIDAQNFIFIKSNFKYINNFINYLDFNKVDGIFADLGVSSHHFDSTERGFSFRYDSKLDMRMNQDSQFSAQNIVNEYEAENLYRIFKYFGELNNCKCLTDSIITYRKTRKIENISDFVDAIKKCIPKNQDYKYLAKVFQALRIETNKEIDVLKDLLKNSEKIIKKNGRLVIITYHSLEDRLVKNYFKTGNLEGKQEKDIYGNIISAWQQATVKPIIPSDEEISKNNRARSAKLRIGIKLL